MKTFNNDRTFLILIDSTDDGRIEEQEIMRFLLFTSIINVQTIALSLAYSAEVLLLGYSCQESNHGKK